MNLGWAYSNVVDIVRASAEDLSAFDSESFDAVTGCYVLMFTNLSKALTEIARVLKPKGLAFILVWKDLPFYTLHREALEELYARREYRGQIPATPVNPMALSPTEHATTSIKEGLNSMQTPTLLRIIAVEDISYPMKIGTLEESCNSGFMLGTPFKQIAEEYGDREDSLKEEFCAIFEELAAKRKDCRVDARTRLFEFGKPVATMYLLEKQYSTKEL
jgi:SAM-dependent methyltransferase